jgi:hypothetical protein
MRMLRASSRRFTILLACGALGCRASVNSAPAPIDLKEEYCWFTVLRSDRAADSVAARFTQGFIAAGFNQVTFARRADTAWATAAPALLTLRERVQVSGRAVAYWHGDSTHFRYFVSIGPPAAKLGGTDSVNFGGNLLDMCTRIARAAAIGWSAPRALTGDESLAIWTRVP